MDESKVARSTGRQRAARLSAHQPAQPTTLADAPGVTAQHAVDLSDALPSFADATVVIVGAGVAGLTCARQLVDSGKVKPEEIVVLEARDRIGGRVHTVPFGKALLDRGGSWVHGVTGNVMLHDKTVAQAKLKLAPVENSERGMVFDPSGRDITKQFAVVEQYFMDLKSRLQKQSGRLTYAEKNDAKTDVCFEDAAARALREEPERVREVMRKAGIDNQVMFDQCWSLLLRGYEGYMACTTKQLSTHWLYDDFEETEQGGDRYVVNGYQQLVQHLTLGLEGACILTGHPVASVTAFERLRSAKGATKPNSVIAKQKKDVGSDGKPQPFVVVRTTNGRSFRAQFVVVTVPVGVLRSGEEETGNIRFLPPLPHWKKNAVANMGFGILDKVALRFKSCFWEPSHHWIGFASTKQRGFPWFYDLYRHYGEPVLVAFVNNDYAKELEAKSDSVVCAMALEVLGLHYGKERVEAEFIEGQMTRWGQDVYARGSYSAVAIPGKFSDYDLLAAPVCGGRVRFAGEATNRPWPCTVHGAHHSGVREATAVLRMLQKQRKSQQESNDGPEDATTGVVWSIPSPQPKQRVRKVVRVKEADERMYR